MIIVHASRAGFVNAVYQAAAQMPSNGAYGLATYPWDLANIANAAPANQKTSLLEVGTLSGKFK
jgi:hypothetical protein